MAYSVGSEMTQNTFKGRVGTEGHRVGTEGYRVGKGIGSERHAGVRVDTEFKT